MRDAAAREEEALQRWNASRAVADARAARARGLLSQAEATAEWVEGELQEVQEAMRQKQMALQAVTAQLAEAHQGAVNSKASAEAAERQAEALRARIAARLRATQSLREQLVAAQAAEGELSGQLTARQRTLEALELALKAADAREAELQAQSAAKAVRERTALGALAEADTVAAQISTAIAARRAVADSLSAQLDAVEAAMATLRQQVEKACPPHHRCRRLRKRVVSHAHPSSCRGSMRLCLRHMQARQQERDLQFDMRRCTANALKARDLLLTRSELLGALPPGSAPSTVLCHAWGPAMACRVMTRPGLGA